MKLLKTGLAPVAVLSALICLQACKAKKLPSKPAQPVATTNTPRQQPVEQPKPQPAVTEAAPPPAAKPNYNFNNIQFEFNSSVLKTASYPALDHIAAQMKMDPTVKFTVNGYASEEGTAEHNLMLSQDRANSVKNYLVNAGIPSVDLNAKGYGTQNPVADNNTEDGRELNRRVEVHKQ